MTTPHDQSPFKTMTPSSFTRLEEGALPTGIIPSVPVDWEHGFEFISPVAVLPGALVRLQVDYTDQLWEPPTWKPVTEMEGRCTKCEIHDNGFWVEIEVKPT